MSRVLYKINYNDKNVRYKLDCYILHTFLLMIILLFLTAIICYYYAKHRSKLGNILRANTIKMESNEFIKNCMCYYLYDINKFKGFDFDNILIEEQSNENILIYNISCKTVTGLKPLCIKFDKIDGFSRVYDRTRYLVLFGLKKYDVITIGLDMLQVKKLVSHMFFSHYYVKVKVYFWKCWHCIML